MIPSLSELIEDILRILPQTQCEACGYKGCRPYAEAMAGGGSIDLCSPGGLPVYKQLKTLLKRSGNENTVMERMIPPRKAVIDDKVCIGCTKCINPCPTEAIVGAKKLNHFVIAADCTGCGLCVAYCPVDCIEMIDDVMSHEGSLNLSQAYRSLHDKKNKVEQGLDYQPKEDLFSDIQSILGEGE